MRTVGVQKLQPCEEVTIKGIGHDLSERGWIRTTIAPEEGGREWHAKSLGRCVATHEIVACGSRRYVRSPEATVTENGVVGEICRRFKAKGHEFKRLYRVSMRMSMATEAEGEHAPIQM